MALRIPKNLIVTSKYTSGGEYMFKSTQKEYKGYYYELNGKIFAGKEFNTYANELLKINIDNINPFLSRASTSTYGFLSNININTNLEKLNSLFIINSDESFYEPEVPFFFCKKINETPIKINRISEETYISLQKNIFYQTTFIGNFKGITQTSEQAYQQMPGLEAFFV
jgi:hypothetical protein